MRTLLKASVPGFPSAASESRDNRTTIVQTKAVGNAQGFNSPSIHLQLFFNRQVSVNPRVTFSRHERFVCAARALCYSRRHWFERALCPPVFPRHVGSLLVPTKQTCRLASCENKG